MSQIQKSELEPRRSPVAEVISGAISGAVIGAMWCITHRQYDGVPVGFAVGAVVGVLAGLWVGFLFGRAGILSVWSVTVNLFRVPFMTIATLFYPALLIVWSRQRELDDR